MSAKWSKGTGGPAGDECYNLVAFDETKITSKINRSQPDDRSPQLAATARPPTVAFSCKDHGADMQVEQAPTLRAMTHSESHANAGGQIAVAFQSRIARNGRGQPEDIVPALNGADAGSTSDMRPMVAISQGDKHVETAASNAAEVLRSLRREIGEEAFEQWGVGVAIALQSEEVLWTALHGSGIRCQAEQAKCELGDGALSREKTQASRSMRNVRQARKGRPSPRRQFPEQLARKLNEALSKLSSQAAQSAAFLLAMRIASEGLGLLQQALHSIQE